MDISSIAGLQAGVREYLRKSPQEQAPPIRVRDLRGQGEGRQLQQVGRRILASSR